MKKVIAFVIVAVLAVPWFVKERSFYTTELGNSYEPGIGVRFHCGFFDGQEILIKYPGAEIHNIKLKENKNKSLAADPNTRLVGEVRGDRDGTARNGSDAAWVKTTVGEVSRQGGVIREQAGGRQLFAEPETVQAYETTSTTITKDDVIVTATPNGAVATKRVESAGETYLLEVQWRNGGVVSVTLDGKRLGRARLGSFLGIPVLGTS